MNTKIIHEFLTTHQNSYPLFLYPPNRFFAIRHSLPLFLSLVEKQWSDTPTVIMKTFQSRTVSTNFYHVPSAQISIKYSQHKFLSSIVSTNFYQGDFVIQFYLISFYVLCVHSLKDINFNKQHFTQVNKIMDNNFQERKSF